MSPDGHSAVVEVSVEDSTEPTLRISGEVDISSLEVLRPIIDKVFAKEPSAVTLDLSEVTFMDSSGVALLLELRQRVDTVILQRPSDAVLLVVEAAGLRSFFRVDQ